MRTSSQGKICVPHMENHLHRGLCGQLGCLCRPIHKELAAVPLQKHYQHKDQRYSMLASQTPLEIAVSCSVQARISASRAVMGLLPVDALDAPAQIAPGTACLAGARISEQHPKLWSSMHSPWHWHVEGMDLAGMVRRHNVAYNIALSCGQVDLKVNASVAIAKLDAVLTAALTDASVISPKAVCVVDNSMDFIKEEPTCVLDGGFKGRTGGTLFCSSTQVQPGTHRCLAAARMLPPTGTAQPASHHQQTHQCFQI
jgi:hypothetical protein